MKKIFAFTMFFVLAFSAVFAGEKGFGGYLGFRADYGRGYGTAVDKESKDYLDIEDEDSVIKGFTAFLKIPIVTQEKITNWNFQFELGFSSAKLKTMWANTNFELPEKYTTYKTFDIAWLVSYDFFAGEKVTVSPFLGTSYSVPFGNDNLYCLTGLLLGPCMGVTAAYDLGPGAIIGDLRYNLHTGRIAFEEDKDPVGRGHQRMGGGFGYAVPRFLVLSIGYQIKL